MALTIKHLNTDASFLLSFEPIISKPTLGIEPQPFHILLDPWITGPSKIFHSKISLTRHKEPACISSLREIPEPDLVIISQHKSDHCNEATLRQLPPSGTRTLIFAEQSAARVIRSWKYFDPRKIKVLKRWEDPRLNGRQTITRICVPALVPGGETGEITVAFIPQRRDISGLHAAIGITYRPPPMFATTVGSPSLRKLSTSRSATPIPCSVSTPPLTPKSPRSYSHLPTIPAGHAYGHQRQQTTHRLSSINLPPLPPLPADILTPVTNQSQLHLTTPLPTPTSLRSVRSTSSIPLSTSTTITPTTGTADRTLSIIFSPHGITYPSLSSYATSHLVSEAALPLTALLHCFDSVSNPWWLGGNILLGAPAGKETATRLGATCWIGAHDGDKEVQGLATVLLKTRKWGREPEEGGIESGEWGFHVAGGREREQGEIGSVRSGVSGLTVGRNRVKGTKVIDLGNGEEVVLTSEGVWNVDQVNEFYKTRVTEVKEMDFPTVGEVMAAGA